MYGPYHGIALPGCAKARWRGACKKYGRSQVCAELPLQRLTGPRDQSSMATAEAQHRRWHAVSWWPAVFAVGNHVRRTGWPPCPSNLGASFRSSSQTTCSMKLNWKSYVRTGLSGLSSPDTARLHGKVLAASFKIWTLYNLRACCRATLPMYAGQL